MRDLDLDRINLPYTSFVGSILLNVNLSGTNLEGSILTDCDLSGANLQNANLARADVSRATFRSCNLRNVNFENANLTDADFSGADITGANLTGANTAGTIGLSPFSNFVESLTRGVVSLVQNTVGSGPNFLTRLLDSFNSNLNADSRSDEVANFTPFIRTLQKSYEKIAKSFGRRETDEPALILALQAGLQDEAQKLLKDPTVDVNATTTDKISALQLAIENDMPDIVMQLLEKGAQIHIRFGKTLSTWRSHNNYETVTEKLVNKTPLIWALQKKYEDIANKLIERGADISEIDEEGNSPLHVAAKKNCPETCRNLIAKGADIQLKDKKGNTPLHLAVYAGFIEIVELLLTNGANPNTPSELGDSPLHIAVLNGHAPVVQVLVQQSGININQENAQGDTPFDWATSLGYPEIIQILTQTGGTGKLDRTEINVLASKANFISRWLRFE